jgi:hypothetical protein
MNYFSQILQSSKRVVLFGLVLNLLLGNVVSAQFSDLGGYVDPIATQASNSAGTTNSLANPVSEVKDKTTANSEIAAVCGNKDFRKSLKSLKLDKLATYCRSESNYQDCVMVADAISEYKANEEFIFQGTTVDYDGLMSGLTYYENICKQKNSFFESKDQTITELQKNVTEPCLKLGAPDFTVCTGKLGDNSFGDDERREKEFLALRQAIIDGQVITTLDEPIGRENLFTRAKVCRTQFVRNSSGDLQPIGNLDDQEVTNREDNDFSGIYAIEITDCDNYIVTKCTPNFAAIRRLELEKSGDTYVMLDKTTNSTYTTLPYAVYCDKIQVIYGEGGIDLFKKYVGFIYRLAASLIGIVAVLVIMISGIQISMAQGDADQVSGARDRITQSLIAIGFLFVSGIILYAVNPTFFTTEDPQIPDPPKQDVTKSAEGSAAEAAGKAEAGSLNNRN